MRKFISAILLVTVLFVYVFPSSVVRADGRITVSIVSQSDTINKGDILAVDVVASKMPNILWFEGIEVVYDDISLSLERTVVPTELPDSLAISITPNDNVITISGSDDVAIDAIDSELTDEDGNKVDLSYYSDKEVTLCTLYFRVKAASYDVVSFMVGGENAHFVDSSKGEYTLNIDSADGIYNSYSFNVTSDVSSDSRIVDLKVNGNTLVDFSPDTYEYVMTVAKEIKSLELSVDPANSFATINMPDTNLTFGDNVLLIEVIAQDGVTTSNYKLTVNRQNSFLQEGANLIDKKGKTYSFISVPSGISIPEGFEETTMIVNGFEVNCFQCVGVRQVLVYVFDGEENTGLYFYDPIENTMILYDKEISIVRESLILTITDVPKSEPIPDGFIPTTFIYAGNEYSGFVDTSGEIIVYMTNEAGKKMFYTYDSSTETFIKYKPVDKSIEKMYKFLFDLVLGIAIIEAMVVIFVVYVVLRFRKERTNPRPRRV